MAVVFHYLPYVLGAGLAGLVLYCVFEGRGTRDSVPPRRVRQVYHRWDDNSTHHD